MATFPFSTSHALFHFKNVAHFENIIRLLDGGKEITKKKEEDDDDEAVRCRGKILVYLNFQILLTHLASLNSFRNC